MKALHKNAPIVEQLKTLGISVTPNDNSLNITLDDEDFKVKVNISGFGIGKMTPEQYAKKAHSDLKQKFKSVTNTISKLATEYGIPKDGLYSRYHTMYKERAKHLNNALKKYAERIGIERDVSALENTVDYPEIFLQARRKKRKIIAYLGETNSGKTFHAFSEIANSFSAAYLAPLRLLALEAYDYLNAQGIETELITGEERIVKEDAICTSSTVECFNSNKQYEVVVIDEIQMIDDRDRGVHFIEALVGANADRVVVTAPEEYREVLERIVNSIGDELEVHIFKRKTKLKFVPPIKIKEVPKNSALVAFSRKNIFDLRDRLPPTRKSSVVYGALGYEVRKKQATMFCNGETDVLVSTDAIGMGLNLPIETIIFTSDTKFDGYSNVRIPQMLVKQIAGRAGRFGKFDVGYISATDHDILEYVKDCMSKPLEVDLIKQYDVKPTKEYMTTMLNKYRLSTIINNWAQQTFPEGSLFKKAWLNNEMSIAEFLEVRYNDDSKRYWELIYCPVDLSKSFEVFTFMTNELYKNNRVILPIMYDVHSIIDMEDALRSYNIILWFVNKFEDLCVTNYREMVDTVNKQIEKISNRLHKRLMQDQGVKKYRNNNKGKRK